MNSNSVRFYITKCRGGFCMEVESKNINNQYESKTYIAIDAAVLTIMINDILDTADYNGQTTYSR